MESKKSEVAALLLFTAGNKIELFYFLPVGWIHRSMSAVKDHEKLVRWWGKSDLTQLRLAGTVHDMATIFTERFHHDLGYRSVIAWPIHERKEGGRIMYFMIHAADHEEAPKLMNRAYRRATGAMEPMEQFQLDFDAAGLDVDAMSR